MQLCFVGRLFAADIKVQSWKGERCISGCSERIVFVCAHHSMSIARVLAVCDMYVYDAHSTV